METTTQLTIFADGLCERNPGGITCCAYVVFEGDVCGSRGAPRPAPLAKSYAYIGQGEGMTNMVAEYRAVRAALKWTAKYAPVRPVEIRSDCEVIVKQLNGVYGCNAESLIALRDECSALLRSLPNTRITWVRRAFNDVADALTRQAYRDALMAIRRGEIR